MSKEVIIVPGFGDDLASYPRFRAGLQELDLAVNDVTPAWGADFMTLVDQTREGLDSKISDDTVAVVAHSMGVLLTLAAMTTPHTNKAVGEDVGLVIVSPGFICAESFENPVDDRHDRVESIEEYFPGQAETVKQFSLQALASQTRVPPERRAVVLSNEEIGRYPFSRQLGGYVADGFGTPITWAPSGSHRFDESPVYVDTVLSATRRVAGML